MPATPLAGGSVKIIDSSTFKISTTIAAAEVTIEPGGMRLACFNLLFVRFIELNHSFPRELHVRFPRKRTYISN